MRNIAASACVDLFGIPVQADTMEQALDRVHNAIGSRRKFHVGVVNAAKIVDMQRDPHLRNAVLDSDVIYADGMSVVWASRMLGRPLPERIAGIDLMHGILQRGQARGYRVFCLGATQEVSEIVCRKFSDAYPGTVIAGASNGYFRREEEADIAESIRRAKVDVLFVAITSPKKERFMARWSSVMQVPVVHGVGGSFDVVAGVVKRAPVAWQRMGLEWLYRVLQEPGRLWKRYLTTNFLFLCLLIRERYSISRRVT